MIKKKFLIVPGMAKSGTTFLFDQLQRQSNEFNPTKQKEVNYFSGHRALEQYLPLFREAESPHWYIDATPQYMEVGGRAVENMATGLAGHNVKIIICSREPYARIFSHYLHDLKRHIAYFDARDFMLLNQNIYNLNSAWKYFFPRSETVRLLIERFGQDNVACFDLSKSMKKWNETNFLKDFLSLETNICFDTSRVSNPGGWIPKVYYHFTNHLDIIVEGKIYALPPKTLLVVNGSDSRLLPNFPRDLAQILINNAQFWNFEFRPSYLGDVANVLWDDYKEMLNMLGCSDFIEPPQEVYRATEPKLSKAIADQLEVIGKLSDIAPAMWKVSKLDNSVDSFPDQFIDRHSYGNYKKKIRTVKNRKERLGWIEKLLQDFEVSPKWIVNYICECLEAEEYDRALLYIKSKPYTRRFIKPERNRLNSIIDRKKINDHEKVQAIMASLH